MDNKHQEISAETGRQSLLRKLPGVDAVLTQAQTSNLVSVYGHSSVVRGIRSILEDARMTLGEKGGEPPSIDQILVELSEWLDSQFAPSLQSVINATGVIVHTNLGRAPLEPEVLSRVLEVSTTYSNLEYDLETGTRGKRTSHVADLLTRLTGAQDALVVNNNASAVLIMLSALCREKEVIISRGQLVEIGGGFRIPDVLRQSGAILIEIGTTNKTHLSDYSRAINDNTGAILVVHRSNFGIVGFTSEPLLPELAAVAKASGIPLLYDQGSGILRDISPFGLAKEVTVQEALDYGADIVAFSGDKLLGGPQAGILCGSAALISQIKRHPLARAVRADKLCLAALTATLQSYITGRELDEIPVWRMLALTAAELESRANRWAASLTDAGLDAVVLEGVSTIGGGSVPGSTLPTRLVALLTPEPDAMAARLRSNNPPVIGRIADGHLVFDPRTVLPDQETELLQAIINSSA